MTDFRDYRIPTATDLTNLDDDDLTRLAALAQALTAYCESERLYRASLRFLAGKAL